MTLSFKLPPNVSPSNILQSVPLAEALPTTGSHLRKMLHGASAGRRAEIGAKLVTGKWRPLWLTPAQSARLVDLGTHHTRLIHAALGRTPKPPSDRKIDRVIAHYGAEALRRRLEHVNENAGHGVNGGTLADRRLRDLIEQVEASHDELNNALAFDTLSSDLRNVVGNTLSVLSETLGHLLRQREQAHALELQ
jgi:hypothetical protein